MWQRARCSRTIAPRRCAFRLRCAFAAGVRKVNVRVMGPDRVLSPVDRVWDTFFLEEAEATDDVRIERGEQGPPEEREPLE